MMTIGQFEEALACARCEADCERLLRIELPNIRCTELERHQLAGRAMWHRLHFALTAEGVAPSAPEEMSIAE